MAVDVRDRNTVGCAYYVAREEMMYFMEDVKGGGIDVVEALKIHVEPTFVCVPTRLDDLVMERLKELGVAEQDTDMDTETGDYAVGWSH